MADPHGRYEQLAVGHVLGGLGMADAAEFRSHLLECGLCRTRVAELRDIAADLEAAERDERQRSRVQTELPRRADDEELAGERAPTGRITVRHVTIAAVLVLLLAGGVAFWNLHLRANITAQSAAAERHADTLRELASGVVVPATFAEGVSGVVVLDDDQVAFSVVGVADVGHGETIVAWLMAPDGEATSDSVLLARSGPLDDGLLSDSLQIGDASEFVISRESGQLRNAPQGETLVRVELGTPDG